MMLFGKVRNNRGTKHIVDKHSSGQGGKRRVRVRGDVGGGEDTGEHANVAEVNIGFVPGEELKQVRSSDGDR